ncbi:MAG: proline dehydrogenase family protein [Bryobacteraceae bacterium]|nr:proline dehydrogenase family protein [Bryobacteraceae bacterium]MDW8378187.1 proline dehydrogenase family protein [Bryobacterales bacterium]
MIRTIFLTLSRQGWLRDWMQNSPWAARFTSRFIAGRTLEQALAVCQKMQREGARFTLDHLGENVSSTEEAIASRDHYLKALAGIADSQLCSWGTVSVKLTQMGLDISDQLGEQNAAAVAEYAARLGARVEIDMESSSYVDRTLHVVFRLQERYGNVRAVIQSYLRRSEGDLQRLIQARVPVRLVKGAYDEPPSIAYRAKRQVDEAFSRQMRWLLESGEDPALATHDERLIREAIAFAQQKAIPPTRFEFQMLYGIRRDLQRELVQRGFRLRVYVPYGDAWYPYFMRRLAERPANVWFVLQNLFRS